MEVSIEWTAGYDVTIREPVLTITTIYDNGSRRAKSVQAVPADAIASMSSFSIFDVIAVACAPALEAAGKLADKRKRIQRAAIVGMTLPGLRFPNRRLQDNRVRIFH